MPGTLGGTRQQVPPDARALLVPDHHDRTGLRQPGGGREGRGPDLGHRVLLAGVPGQQREHPRHERDPRRHWRPRIARSGGRRPAIDHTMSTVCRVSSTWWTR